MRIMLTSDMFVLIFFRFFYSLFNFDTNLLLYKISVQIARGTLGYRFKIDDT